MSLFFARPGVVETRAIDDSSFVAASDADSPSSSMNRALRLTPVYAAVSQLADDVASLPLQAYTKGPTGVRQRAEDPPLLRNPAASGTRYDWIHKAMVSLLMRGNAYGLITSTDRLGFPSTIEWLYPDHVTVDETSGRPVYSYLGVEIESARMLHIAAFVMPGSCVGLSPIRHFQLVINTGMEAQKSAHDWHANGSHPSHMLRNNAQTLAQSVVDAVRTRYKATTKTGEPFVTGSDWEISALGVSAADAQFLEAIKATATQVAAIFRVPPEDIGGVTGSSLTYSTVEMQDLRYLARSLRRWLVRFEQALERIAPPSIYYRFNADAMLRSDAKTRAEVFEIALRNKYLSVDEVRELEDRAPLVARDVKAFADVGLPALLSAGIVSPAWAADQVGAPSEGLSTKPLDPAVAAAIKETPR